ncbi:GbsR/MarR family transcriptional regulator [Salinactinospora qingdaonensis]|uniref:MarR family transcriptional regulator n=1 Tax=Salinactinospora qingdaonensis TaxID=702744 RepID=A0ABP7GC54_9ACTN
MSDGEVEAERHAFIEELAQFFEDSGLPRMEGRVLGWLVVCTPAHQSAEEIATALGASRGAISMAVRLLQRAEAVERVSFPGTRRHYYRLRPGMWRREIDRRVHEATAVRTMAEDGLNRLASAPDQDLQRLRDLYDMYAFLEREYLQIRDRWHDHETGHTPKEHEE